MRNFCLMVLAFLMPFLNNAQEDNQNVDGLGSLSYDVSLSDIWGYATETNEYALVGLNNAFSIVDVTDPSAPKELHNIPGPSSTWRDIKTWNSFAYVVNETGEGCLIVDMAHLPDSIETFTFTGDEGVTFSTAHNVFIDNNGYLYIIGSNYGQGGCIIYDLNENPTEPRFIGVYDANYVHDAYARDTLLYTFEGGDLVITDISDPANPKILGSATSYGYTHNGWVSDDGNTLFTTDETAGTWVVSWDISDPTDIKELDKWQSSPGEGVIPHNAFVLGDYVITSYYTDGVTITDVSDPSNMVQVGNFDSSEFSGGGFNGVWGVYPYLPSGLILATDIQNGLFVLDPEYKKAGYLNGKVIDAESGKEVNGAKVLIDGIDKFTNIEGVFKYGSADSSSYDITVSKLGYNVQVVNDIKIVPGETTEIIVELNQQARIYNIEGNIFDAASGEVIRTAATSFSLNGEAIAVETVNGQFKIDSLYLGKYQIIAGNWGHYTVALNVDATHSNQKINIYLNEGIYDDFALDYGWTTETNSSAGGEWELTDPEGFDLFGFTSLTGDDIDDDFGNNCYVTGDSESFDFVASGKNILTSPVFDCSAMENPFISFYSYFVNFGYTGNGNQTVDFILTNGTDTVTIDFDDNSNASAAWKFHNIGIKDMIDLTENMQFSVVANGPSGEELLESGLDVFQVLDSATAVVGSSVLMDDEMPPVVENSEANEFDILANDDIACENPELTIVSYERQFFSNIAISENGILSFDVPNFSTPGEYKIVYAVNCGGLDYQSASVSVTIDDGLGIFNNTNAGYAVSLIPNPAIDLVSIKGLENLNLNNLSVEVYNAIGKLMLKDELGVKNTINLETLKSGLYLVNILNENEIVGNSKLIVE